ncbi:MAG: DUF1992 domain-containing protein [Peptococcaceae bacterium]|nr:DUF1992 domain-containing protein [Peptococcaceae bacterium]
MKVDKSSQKTQCLLETTVKASGEFDNLPGKGRPLTLSYNIGGNLVKRYLKPQRPNNMR